MKRTWNTWREGLTITGLYGLTAVLMTYPLLFRLTSGLASQSLDGWIFYWNTWWLQKAVATGQSVFFTTWMYYPRGVSLAGHSFSFTHSIFSLLFQPFVGPIAAYNLAVWLIFPISGLGMYCLAKHLTGSRSAAWLAGLVFAYAPYHLTKAMGHPNLAYVQWIPFAVLYLLKALQSGRTGDTVASVIFFTLTAFSGQHLLVLAFTWTAIFLPLYGWAEGRDWTRLSWARAGLIPLCTLVLATPLWWPAVSYGLHGQSARELAPQIFDESQSDLLTYFLPPRFHQRFNPSVAESPIHLRGSAGWPYLGYSAVMLASVGALTLRRRSLPWVISAAACVVLALGPHLRFNGSVYQGFPLPFALLQHIFPYSFLRTSDRFNVMVSLPIGVLAAYGLAALEQRGLFARRIAAAANVAALSGLILVEYLILPFHMLPPPKHSPFVARMAEDSTPYAILDLPMGYLLHRAYLYWQTIHNKPIVQGYVSRTPLAAYDYIEGNPLLRALREPMRIELTDTERPTALKQLADDRIRYILVHSPKKGPEVIKRYRAIIGSDPVYSDELLEVYAIPQ